MLAINLLDNKKETIRNKIKVLFDKLKEKKYLYDNKGKIYFVVTTYNYLGHSRAFKEIYAGKLDKGKFVTYKKIEDNPWEEDLMESIEHNTIIEADPKYLNKKDFLKEARKNGLKDNSIKKLIKYEPIPLEEEIEEHLKLEAMKEKESLEKMIGFLN